MAGEGGRVQAVAFLQSGAGTVLQDEIYEQEHERHHPLCHLSWNAMKRRQTAKAVKTAGGEGGSRGKQWAKA